VQFWLDIAAFALKALLILATAGGLAVIVILLARKQKPAEDEADEIASLNRRYDDQEVKFAAEILPKKAFKAFKKARKQQAKSETGYSDRKHIYVIGFNGDLKASGVTRLARQIDVLLTVAKPARDEIVLKIDSPGGTITGYGLAAAQLLRIKQAKLTLTVCVDQVAASGGYLMACTADKILAAPFAILGSIGVVAAVPNLHRLLQKNDIDYEEMTAGEYKRTVTVLGKITPEGREHFRERLGDTHAAFKDFVHANRPQLDLGKVANGDYWYGTEALALGLADQLTTSDDYLFQARHEGRIFTVSGREKKSLLSRLLGDLTGAVEAAIGRIARYAIGR
jgi:serine protease SohB